MNPNDEDDRTVIRPAARASDAPAPAPVPPAPPAARAPDNDHGNALPVGVRLGEFEITGVLGEGGFGIVYLAQDHSLQRRVALKEYLPSALAGRSGPTTVSVKSERHRETFELGLRSFVNEAQLLAQFDHPSLVKVYRFWEANGSAYMVMPFYQGGTLRDRLREMASPPDEAWLLGLLAPLTEALRVIHAMQCYHRDIAPDNVILLAHNGRPLLLDFGAARRVIGDMTQALTVILKPGYAPLEQYAEIPGMKQGPWTDVYALAAVVYFAVTGKTPPPAVGRMVNDTCVPLAEFAAGRYSDDFLRAIDRALRVRPEDRTQSIDALRQELGLTDVPDSAHADFQATHAPSRVDAAPSTFGAAPRTTAKPVAPPPPAARGGRTGVYAGIGVVVLALVAFGAWRALAPKAEAPVPVAATPAPAPVPVAPAPTATPAPAPVAATATPAPAPAPAAPPPAPADAFDQVLQGQAAGFDVQAKPTKTRLRIDKDNVGFTVNSARDGYVYVIQHGADGLPTLVFPNDKSSNNHIRAGQSLALPQASWEITATDPAGDDHYLVIVSQSKRDYGAGRKHVLWFRTLPNPADEGAAVLLGKADCASSGCEAYGAAQFTVTVVH